MSHNVFAYGTLMLPRIFEALTGNVLNPQAATLNGYSRYMFKKRCYPGIIRDNAGCVEGVLYEGIDDRTLSILDWFEDVIYERQLLTVQTNEKKSSAFVYVVSNRYQNRLDKTPWLLEEFIEIHSASYIYNCAEYKKQWDREY